MYFRYVDAIEKLEKVTELGMQNYHISYVYTVIGHCYFDQDLYEEALEAYHTALNLEPDSVACIVNLGIAYRNYDNADVVREMIEDLK